MKIAKQKMEMFVASLLPKVDNLFIMSYQFGTEKCDLYCLLFLFTLHKENEETQAQFKIQINIINCTE